MSMPQPQQETNPMPSPRGKNPLAGALLALLVSACANEPAGDAAAVPVAATPPSAATTPAAPIAETAAATTAVASEIDAATDPLAPAPPVQEVTGKLQATIGQAVGRAVSLSSDAQAHEYAGVLAAVTGQMLDTNPEACARLLLPAQFGPIGWDEFPPSQRERFVTLQQALIATAQSAPTPAPDEAVAGPLYDAMAEKIYAKHGEQALDGLQGDAGAAALCRTWNRIYAGLAAESVADGGRVVRWLNAP
jgi:hypothetical protein